MYEALYTHTDEYNKLAGNLRRQRRDHKIKREEGEISDPEFCLQSQEIQVLSQHLQDLEWRAPGWDQINKAVKKHRSASDKKQFLEDLVRELSSHITSILAQPDVRNKWHVDIDMIDNYLEALYGLQERILLEISYLSRSLGMEDYMNETEELATPALYPHLLCVNEESKLSVDALAKRELLTFTEAMLYLEIGRSTIYRWMDEGKIPPSCYIGNKAKARFYRDKLDTVFFSEPDSRTKDFEYLRINWFRESNTADDLLKELAAANYIEEVKYQNIVIELNGDTDLSTSKPINWIFRPNAIQESLEFLISLIFLLIDYKAIVVKGTGKKTQTTAYIMRHFRFCGSKISDRTLDAAKRQLFSDNGEFSPRHQIKDLLTKVFKY